MKRILLSILIALALLIPSVAKADTFFDDSDGKWWMNESAWTPDTSGGGSIAVTGNNLGVSTLGGTGDVHADYTSNWVLNMDSNFSLQVDYHFVNSSGTGLGGIELAIGPNVSDDDGGIAMARGNNAGAQGFLWQWKFSETDFGEQFAPQSSTDGTLFLSYVVDGANKTATLSSNTGESKLFNLSSVVEPGELLAVSLGGGTPNGLQFGGTDAYFSNFKVTNGTPMTAPVAPEPISSALFLLGGGVLATRRFKKGKKS